MTGETPDQVSGAAAETDNEKLPETPAPSPPIPAGSESLSALPGRAQLLLAFVLMIFYFGWINEVPAVQVSSTTVEWITPASAAAAAGIQSGDVITHFDNVEIPIGNRFTHGPI